MKQARSGRFDLCPGNGNVTPHAGRIEKFGAWTKAPSNPDFFEQTVRPGELSWNGTCALVESFCAPAIRGRSRLEILRKRVVQSKAVAQWNAV